MELKDWLNSINLTKEDLSEDPEDIKKEEELAFGKLRRRQPSHGKLRL